MRVVIGLVVVIGIAAGLLTWRPWESATGTTSQNDGFYTVERGDLKITLTERGTLKTQKSQMVKSKISGRERIAWLVEEGATVAAGDVLVELDRTELEKEIEDLDNKVIQLESELKAAETEVTIQTAQNLTDTERAALDLEVARVTLEKFEEGDHPQELRRLQLAIEKATSDLERAQYRFRTMPDMLEKGFITEDQYIEEELNVSTAEKEKVSAELALKLYEDYQLPLDLKELKATVTEAERNVDRAKQQAEARLEGKNAIVRQKTRSLTAARDRLAKAQADMGQMTLRAVDGGIVFYGDPDDSRRAEEIKVGAEVWPNRTILTIPDPTRMVAAIKVHESDIAKVREGGAAVVRSEVRRNQSYPGVVSHIGSVANAGNRRWGDNVRRFNVEIGLELKDANLKPGTSAEVELDLGTVTGILFVPLQAIHARDGRFYTYVSGPDAPRRVRVWLGKANESFVEVRKGLEEGDRVLLYTPEPGEAEIDESEDGESSGNERPSGADRPKGAGPSSGAGDGAADRGKRRGKGEGRGGPGRERGQRSNPPGKPQS